MSAQEDTYYVGDNVLFSGLFKDQNGNELTPTAVEIQVWKSDGVNTITTTPGTISGNFAQFQYNGVVEGRFVLYMKPEIATNDQSKTIHFRVIPKDGRQT